MSLPLSTDFPLTTPAPLDGRGHHTRSDGEPPDLVVQVGTEVARQTTSALDCVDAMMASGRVDRAGLYMLRDHIQAARRSAILGLRVNRISRGCTDQNPEAIDVSQALRHLLARREYELTLGGLEVRQSLASTVVQCDPAHLRTMLAALLDWGIEHATFALDLHLRLAARPARGELLCSLRHGLTLPTLAHISQTLDTLSWRLVKTSASALGFGAARDDGDSHSTVRLRMPCAAARMPSTPAPESGTEEASNPSATDSSARRLTGSHVLVVSGRREVRSVIREVTRPLDVMLDFVGSAEQARAFCLEGLPHALIFESTLGAGYMHRLLADLVLESPSLAAIEVVEEGSRWEVVTASRHPLSRVGKAALATVLPRALIFELSRER